MEMNMEKASDYVFAILYNRLFRNSSHELNASTRAEIYRALDKANYCGVNSSRVINCAKNCDILEDFYKSLEILEKDDDNND